MCASFEAASTPFQLVCHLCSFSICNTIKLPPQNTRSLRMIQEHTEHLTESLTLGKTMSSAAAPSDLSTHTIQRLLTVFPHQAR